MISLCHAIPGYRARFYFAACGSFLKSTGGNIPREYLYATSSHKLSMTC